MAAMGPRYQGRAPDRDRLAARLDFSPMPRGGFSQDPAKRKRQEEALARGRKTAARNTLAKDDDAPPAEPSSASARPVTRKRRAKAGSHAKPPAKPKARKRTGRARQTEPGEQPERQRPPARSGGFLEGLKQG